MIESYLTNTCLLIVQTKDQWGTATGEEKVKTRCFHKASTRLIRDYKGQEVASSGSLLFARATTVTPGQFVEVGGRRHLILRVDDVRDFNANGKKAWLS